MKKLVKPLMFIFFATAIAACSKDTPVEVVEDEGTRPVVDFAVEPGDDPFTWKFTNNSSDFKEVTWRFGDDSVAYSNDPEHVYMTTGTFQVTLTATSESGKTSQYLREITIDPNEILGISATKTGTPNELAFKAQTDLDIESIEWRFTDTSTPTTKTFISDDLEPLYKVPTGVIVPARIQLTTKKGSVAIITKDASTEGIVTNFMDAMVGYTVTEDNTGNANENATKLFDKKDDNKFLIGWAADKEWNVTMEFSSAQTLKFYSIGNGNDSPERDPKIWTMEGSNDGENWTIVDSRSMEKHWTDQLLERGFPNTDAGLDWKKFYFAVSNPGSFKYYRLNINENFGGGAIQFGEVALFK
ncbi:PKD domain-containing protein [Pedobacter faecalis]|uniref:PKD domain-containing protein n=1 Tax=Pedobacter faecalis TaxID=3041495 RepID=UPI00254BAD05|nr:PKD domain-containing protein [Pedobacter sp. ELA7]